jgi:hypothetical protein
MFIIPALGLNNNNANISTVYFLVAQGLPTYGQIKMLTKDESKPFFDHIC